jgi:hypothetical protein
VLGNHAIQRLLATNLQEEPRSAAEPAAEAATRTIERSIIQRAKHTKGTKKGSTKTLKQREKELRSKINKTLKQRGMGAGAHRALINLEEEIDGSTMDEIKALERKYHVLIATHAAALNMPAAHPAGAQYVNPMGQLVPPYNQGIRGHMYPSGYNAAAMMAKQNWINAHTNSITGQVNCGGTPTRPAHQTTAGNITIEHNVAVADHWNNGWNLHLAGRNTDRQNRNAFYNDATNHLYLCGPCNSSLGSGGVLYRTDVTVNFRM